MWLVIPNAVLKLSVFFQNLFKQEKKILQQTTIYKNNENLEHIKKIENRNKASKWKENIWKLGHCSWYKSRGS